MSPRAKVLVGITTYNRADILPKAVESALAQSYAEKSVAVVDDASTDGTPALRGHFPHVAWIRLEKNAGYLWARNHLMLTTDADYYLSLDDDAWFMRDDEIAIAVALLEANPRVGAVAYDILSPDQPDVRERSDAVPSPMFIGCGHVLRLEAVRALGGYTSFPGSYGSEEKDFCLCLMEAGYEIVKLPGVHVWHDKTSTARDLVKQHTSGVCNDLTLAVRRTPFVLLPLALAWKSFAHLRFARRRGLLRPCLSGMRLFLRSLPAIWRGRSPVSLRTMLRYSKLT